MKDDLIKILNFKLKQIKDNIEILNQINGKIEDENNELDFIQKTIENFKGEEHGFDIYKFSSIDRETFNKLLMNLSNEVLVKFGTNSCNYDGLVYLINGINNGISLTLTQEQIEAINLFIDKLLEKEKEYQDVISSLNDDKQKLEVKDLDVLYDMENKYSLIIENIDDKKYVTEIDEIVDAINYSELNNERAFDVLCYLLKYNSEIYELMKDNKEISENASKNVEVEEEKIIDLTKPFEVTDNKDETDEFQNTNMEPTIELENPENENFEVDENEESTDDEQYELDEKEKYSPILSSDEEEGYFELDVKDADDDIEQSIDMVFPNINLDLPIYDDLEDYDIVNIPLEGTNEVYLENNNNQIELDSTEDTNDVELEHESYHDDLETKEIDIEINVDDNKVELEEHDEVGNSDSLDSDNLQIAINENPIEVEIDEVEETRYDDSVANNEILNNKKDEEFILFLEENKLSIDNEINRTLLTKGNIENYQTIINKLKELEVFEYLKDNINLLIQILLYSDISVIDDIMKIVEKDLSVDSNDKKITTNIVFKTMPSIFIKGESGNYDNFVKNIEFLKEIGVDLINLFDFSREVFTADNKYISNNYELVRNYDLTVNAYNAKYLLLLPNINNRIDYYVESIYKDNSENGNNEMFDGFEMIKLYPNKLNTVNDETIKRLRFSSENGLKVFGNKEKSLTAEITNLNVDMINMSENFLNSLFNNKFDLIAQSDIDKYIELVNSNEVVEMKEEGLLEKLSGYKVGLRYFIGNINVSSNKVIRNYNILINNGVNEVKALMFAICYNLVITDTEYERLKLFINGLGGN